MNRLVVINSNAEGPVCIMRVSHYMAVSTMAMTRVLMKTLLGDMTLELDGEKAPATVANFVLMQRLDITTERFFTA